MTDNSKILAPTAEWVIGLATSLSGVSRSVQDALRSPIVSQNACTKFYSCRKPRSPSLHLCVLRSLWPIACAILCALFLLFLLAYCKRNTRPANCLKAVQDTKQTREALKALLTIITPTCSFWPPNYLTAAKHTGSSQDTVIKLSLRHFVTDVLDGRIELRDARLDLPDFISGDLKTPDHKIRLHVELAWWLDVLEWIMTAQFAKTTVEICQSAKLDRLTKNSQEGAIKQQMRASAVKLTLLQANVDEHPVARSLDAVPRHCLEAYIRALQISLPTGAYTYLGITIRSPSVSFTSNSFVLAALPFFSRTSSAASFKDVTTALLVSPSLVIPASATRTTTPLFTSLSQILELLTSGPTPLSIKYVQNVSEEYALFLNSHVRNLEEDAKVRSGFVHKWGLRKWREERFLTAWEAGTVNAKLLDRWTIVVQK
ncbi:hypothetical protein OBBRIDRAFT_885248 [Obba rivulosa]|uniref:Uncharacterized protein n=1 Tax=Obba rivulosa TaxID=1052685 RepID=A0A8E2DQM0_9APHY|nr:hypothetical protein OBBRIDRAFT_885248 [Obba rivulosa]